MRERATEMSREAQGQPNQQARLLASRPDWLVRQVTPDRSDDLVGGWPNVATGRSFRPGPYQAPERTEGSVSTVPQNDRDCSERSGPRPPRPQCRRTAGAMRARGFAEAWLTET
jgi:hypothetical protein